MAELPFYENLFVDSCLALASRTMGAPIQTITLRKQLRKGEFNKSVWQILINEKDFKGLWKGNLWRCSRYFPLKAVDMFTDEYLDSFVGNISNGYMPGLMQSIFSNVLGNTLSLVLVFPIDALLLKTIYDMDSDDKNKGLALSIEGKSVARYDDKSVRDHVAAIWDWVSETYRGFGASLGRMVVYHWMYFILYANVEYSLHTTKISHWQQILLRFTLQLGADFFSYPLDAISRLQVIHRYSLFEALENCWKDGFYGFYHSYHWNIVDSVFGVLISLSFSELKRMYTNMRGLKTK